MSVAGSAHSTMLPPQVVQSLGLHRGNYVVYEKVGVDGRVHRNFVTVDSLADENGLSKSSLSVTGKNRSRSGGRRSRGHQRHLSI